METMICPRRSEGPAFPGLSSTDEWRMREGKRTCSFCGSMHPDDVIAAIEAGNEVTPTDKGYKLYVSPGHGKAYFQHFEKSHKDRFIQLCNEQKMKIGYPGHFYVLPFFCKHVGDADAS